MSDVFRDPNAGWAALIVVVLPLLIIGVGELEERLRQHDSALQRPVSILRTWVMPLIAAWALARVLFDPGADNALFRLLGTVLVIALSAAALAALAVVTNRIRHRPRAEGRRSVPRLLLALPRLLILFVTAWVLIAGIWSVDLSAALTALGVTSLVVSFALQDTLGGIASGFTLLADQPFQPGDWIKTGDLEGQVLDINWRSSRIQTRNGDLVVVPNGQLANATITNFDEPTRLHRVVVPLQVAFSNAPTRVREMLLAAARSTPGVLAEPPPNVHVVQIDDPLMGYQVHVWIDDYSIAPRVASELSALIWYHSHRFDVPLPSPAQDLYLWDGNTVAVEGRRDHASLARAIRSAPLLAELDDDEIDRLASASRPAHFARGEQIVGADDDAIGVLEVGDAQLVLRTDAGDEPILELHAGDLIGLLGAGGADSVVIVAVSDCEVVGFEPDVAGAVISRAPGLNTAIEQVTSSRRRRVQRILRRLEQERLAAEISDRPAIPRAASPDEEAG